MDRLLCILLCWQVLHQAAHHLTPAGSATSSDRTIAIKNYHERIISRARKRSWEAVEGSAAALKLRYHPWQAAFLMCWVWFPDVAPNKSPHLWTCHLPLGSSAWAQLAVGRCSTRASSSVTLSGQLRLLASPDDDMRYPTFEKAREQRRLRSAGTRTRGSAKRHHTSSIIHTLLITSPWKTTWLWGVPDQTQAGYWT